MPADPRELKELAVHLRKQSRTADSLTLEYSVKNNSDDDVYLFNRLYRGRNDSGEYEVDPNIVYVTFIGNQAELRKAVPDVPPDRRVPFYTLPFATELAAGATYEEALTLPLPLAPWHQYGPPPGEPQIPKSVELVLGYMPKSHLGDRPIGDMPTVDGPALMVYCSPYDQRLARSARIEV